MNWKVFVGAAALALAACGEEPSAESPAAENQEERFDLPYEKLTLDNGLEVILHVDRSDPIVAFSTVVHVGSSREKTGRTGFAHFFEHMAFNDSENVPRGWNRKAIPEWGGQRNGGTWSDGTIYFEVVPKDAVDKILWIDSDRLGFMINTVTQEALEREKQVVKNEKRQRVDNAAYGHTSEVIKDALYPDDHPYSWSVIGQLEDLQAATLDDLREFYGQYYGAANATLAIAGDFDPEEMREKVEYWFGEIRRGPLVPVPEPMPVSLDEDANLYFEDNFAKLPELRLTFPTVEAQHPDEIPLQVLGAMLAGSKGAPLYEIVVEEREIAPGASSFNRSQELAGEFTILIRTKPGVDLDEALAAVEEAFDRFEEEGVDPNELRRIRAEQETRLYNSVSTVLGKANQLARDNEFAGDPAFLIQRAERLEELTAEDIERVYATYIQDKPRVITSFVPKGSPELAVEGASLAEVVIEEVRNDVAQEEVSAGDVAEFEKTPTAIDRSEPPFGELPLFKMPDIYEADLGTASVLGIESNETPVVTFSVVVEGGAWDDPAGKEGRATLLGALMNEGTAEKTAAEFEQAVGLLGAGISASSGTTSIAVSATTLSRNFEETVALVEELLASPRFDEDILERERAAILTSIKSREGNPNAIAQLSFRKLLYGENHPVGRPADGSEASVSSLTLADVEAAHTEFLGGKAKIQIAGDIPPARAKEAFASLADLFGGQEAGARDNAITPPSYDGRVFFIDFPGSKQSVIVAGKLVPGTGEEGRPEIDFTNEKLGGGISGDLAQTLRIEKGYTYGAYSQVTDGTFPQGFIAATSVRANATGPSLEIIRQMINDHGPTFTEEDAEITKTKLVKGLTRSQESLGAKLGLLRSIALLGKSKTFIEDEQSLLLSMDVADFQETAATYLREEEMIYVVVGDGETQREAVRAFADGAMVELALNGEPAQNAGN